MKILVKDNSLVSLMDLKEAFPNWGEDIKQEKAKEDELEFVKKNNLIELNHDYDTINAYYWDEDKEIMYEVERHFRFKYTIINDERLKRKNKIGVKLKKI